MIDVATHSSLRGEGAEGGEGAAEGRLLAPPRDFLDEAFLSDLKKCLRPGGVLAINVVATANRSDAHEAAADSSNGYDVVATNNQIVLDVQVSNLQRNEI
jgi:hypothetical protein